MKLFVSSPLLDCVTSNKSHKDACSHKNQIYLSKTPEMGLDLCELIVERIYYNTDDIEVGREQILIATGIVSDLCKACKVVTAMDIELYGEQHD